MKILYVSTWLHSHPSKSKDLSLDWFDDMSLLLLVILYIWCRQESSAVLGETRTTENPQRAAVSVLYPLYIILVGRWVYWKEENKAESRETDEETHRWVKCVEAEAEKKEILTDVRRSGTLMRSWDRSTWVEKTMRCSDWDKDEMTAGWIELGRTDETSLVG